MSAQIESQEGLPIASVEQVTGIARATLRIWERRYGFPQPGRDLRGERCYPDEQVRKLRLIADLMAQGHRPGRLVQMTAPQLMALAGRGVTLYGINYKDERGDAIGFLDGMGDPFLRIGADTTGRVGIDFGVYGVPETFVVDGTGTITYKHVGPIMPQDIDKYIMPAIEKAQAGG